MPKKLTEHQKAKLMRDPRPKHLRPPTSQTLTFNPPRPLAYEQQCTSPRGVRQIKHRTDVIAGDIVAAQERSRAFVQHYEKQGWSVIERPVYV